MVNPSQRKNGSSHGAYHRHHIELAACRIARSIALYNQIARSRHMLNKRKIVRWALGSVLFCVVAILLILFDTWGGMTIIKYALENNEQDNLSFSFSSCRHDPGDRKNTVHSQKWADNRLTIEGTVHPNCGATWLFGSYDRESDELTLKYKSTIAYYFACTCPKRVTYTIDNIPKQQCNISFREEEPLQFNPAINYFLFEE